MHSNRRNSDPSMFYDGICWSVDPKKVKTFWCLISEENPDMYPDGEVIHCDCPLLDAFLNDNSTTASPQDAVVHKTVTYRPLSASDDIDEVILYPRIYPATEWHCKGDQEDPVKETEFTDMDITTIFQPSGEIADCTTEGGNAFDKEEMSPPPSLTCPLAINITLPPPNPNATASSPSADSPTVSKPSPLWLSGILNPLPVAVASKEAKAASPPTNPKSTPSPLWLSAILNPAPENEAPRALAAKKAHAPWDSWDLDAPRVKARAQERERAKRSRRPRQQSPPANMMMQRFAMDAQRRVEANRPRAVAPPPNRTLNTNINITNITANALRISELEYKPKPKPMQTPQFSSPDENAYSSSYPPASNSVFLLSNMWGQNPLPHPLMITTPPPPFLRSLSPQMGDWERPWVV